MRIKWFAGKKAKAVEPEEADEEAKEEEAEEDEGWEDGLTKAALKQEVLKILEGANMDEFNLKSLMKQLGAILLLRCHQPSFPISSSGIGYYVINEIAAVVPGQGMTAGL